MFMMIDKRYGVKSDDSNMILFEIKKYGEKSKKAGENYTEVIGYFKNIENVLKRYMSLAIMNDTTSTTIKKLLVKLGSISKTIKGIKL